MLVDRAERYGNLFAREGRASFPLAMFSALLRVNVLEMLHMRQKEWANVRPDRPSFAVTNGCMTTGRPWPIDRRHVYFQISLACPALIYGIRLAQERPNRKTNGRGSEPCGLFFNARILLYRNVEVLS
jgi:hypothetical protein